MKSDVADPPRPDVAKLSVIASAIRTTRRETIEQIYNPKKDWLGWGISCLIFERICGAIIGLGGEIPSKALHFVFKIDDCPFPLRFYRGKRDRKAPASTLSSCADEAKAIQGELFGTSPIVAYRILYETDRKTLLVQGVYLVALTQDGTPVNAWEIPLEPETAVMRGVTAIKEKDKPLELKPAPLKLIEEIIAEEEQELRREEEGTA